ncbi:MAG TPA: AMP-binding protein, partial [Albitalea sp.]
MLCPKCHRALDDTSEGAYICCAGAVLQWRCRGCAKVSEGFAFPYGRCPQCGDVLEAVDGAARDPEAALEGVRTAFEIELGGRAFYQRAAVEVSDPELKRLFGRFAVMEGEHMETLSRRYHLDVPPPSPALRLEVAAIYAGATGRPAGQRPETPESLFRIAIELEERAAAFFTARAADTAEGSAEQRLYRELAAEEREHASLLATEFARWQSGKPGLFSDDPLAGRTGAAPTAAANAAAILLDGGQAADRPALACGDETMSYGELRQRVARIAGYWRARGIQPGERVAIKLPDGFDWVAAFLGTMWAGAIAVPVNPRIPAPEWQYILEEAGFSVILAESAEDTPEPWRKRVLHVDAFRRALDGTEPAAVHPVDPLTPAFWCHSSGTSGKPKAVVHAHRFAQRIEQVSRDALGIVPGDKLLASSKLFFSYPQTNAVWAGLKLGATIVVDPAWPTAAGIAAAVAKHRPTVLLSVPSLYRNLLHDGHAPGIAKAGVRLCISAGEALPPSLRDEWRAQTGLSIANGYGASETLVLVMIDRGDGRGFSPSPGVDVRPLDEVAPGLPTRLLIRAPTLALGYLDRPQAQAENFRDDAFCPADLFARNADGGWQFAGREDSLVKIHGRWVNLVELEEKLAATVPGVKEAAAVVVPDADGVDAVAFFFAPSGD